MRILLIYHFFHPDTVVSARLFSELAVELAAAGHTVTVFTGNRCIRSSEKLAPHELWNGVEIVRFSRPGFSQGGNFRRLFNSGILQLKWLRGFRKRRREFDAVIVGTAPQFDYLMFPFLRRMNRKVKIVHWAFDIYPEAILVNSPRWMRMLASLTKPFVPWAYSKVDVMVDIGACMRELLLKYRHHAECHTLTPWALAEPETIPEPDPAIRRELFGDAKIGLLYSGTVGYAHDLSPLIALARECRKRGIDAAFCFAGYGNCYEAQCAEITPVDTNIRLAGFASPEELEKRLAAADVHLISLRPGWEGIVVPSKFFGALAIGRPVIFSGARLACIARWIAEENLGEIMDGDLEGAVAFVGKLLDDPEALTRAKAHAFGVYHARFSKKVVTDKFLKLFA